MSLNPTSADPSAAQIKDQGARPPELEVIIGQDEVIEQVLISFT